MFRHAPFLPCLALAGCLGGSTGIPIVRSPDSRTALLVVDLQRDFLEDGGRLPVARAQLPALVASANRLVDEAAAHGGLVVYIGNEFPRSQVLQNWVRHGAALAGSSGAALDPRVHRVSPLYFSKAWPDAFSNADFDAFLRREHVGRLVVVGVFADQCVRATVLAARNRGYDVIVVPEGVAAGSEASRERALRDLAARGAVIAATEAAALAIGR